MRGYIMTPYLTLSGKNTFRNQTYKYTVSSLFTPRGVIFSTSPKRGREQFEGVGAI
jgi:hypothetical protein